MEGKMDLLEGIKSRRSIRGFKDTPIPEETLNKILEAATNSPSYTNTQPWEVAVVAGQKRDELSKLIFNLAKEKAEMHPDIPSPNGWSAEHKARSGEHGARRLAALEVDRDDAVEREKLMLMNFEFYGAPCAMFLFMEGSLNEWSVYDMGLFSQNLILAAHYFGIGTCLQASVPNYSREIKQFLEIDESKKLIIAISMGYPDEDAKLNTYRSVKLKAEEFTKIYR
jgi:nitroreductase